MPDGPSGNQRSRAVRSTSLALLGVAWLAFVFPLFAGRVHFPTDYGGTYFQTLAHPPSHPSTLVDIDSYNALFPWHTYLGAQLRAGHLPLWDPSRFFGVPYAADVSMGTFYPPNWLFVFGHVALVTTLIWAASLAASLLLMWWFLRVLGLHPAAASLGAIAWTFGGFMVAWSTGDPLLGAAIWLPLALGGFEVARRGRPGRGIPLAAVGLALSALAGHAQIAYYVWLSMALFVAVTTCAAAFQHRRGGRPAILRQLARGAALGAATFAIAGGLAAVQVLGTLEYTHQIVSQRFTYHQLTTLKLNPRFLATALLPDYFGNPVNHNYAFTGYYYTQTAMYAGVLSLPLAAAGLLHRQRRLSVFFAGLLAVGLGAALATPLLHLMALTLPGINRFISLTRILILVDVGLAGLAALGLDALLARTSRVPVAVAVGTAALTAIGVATLVAGRWATPVTASYLGQRGVRALVILGLGSGLMVVAAHRRSRPAAVATAALLVVALTGTDLWAFGFRYHPFEADTPVVTSTPELAYLSSVAGPRPRYAMAGTAVLSQNASMAFGLYSLHGYDPFLPATMVEAMGLVQPAIAVQARVGNSIDPMPTVPTEPPFLDLAGIRSLTASPGVTQPGTLAHTGSGTGSYDIYNEASALPPAFVVPCWEVGSDTSALATMGTLSDAGFLTTATLAPGVGATPGPPAAGCGSAAPAPTPTVTRYGDEEVDITLPASSPGGLLVLTDQWYPGWAASIDGRAAPILRADVAFRAVAIGPGSHTVRFVYHPRWPLEGLAITVIALVACAFLALAPRGDRRGTRQKQRPPEPRPASPRSGFLDFEIGEVGEPRDVQQPADGVARGGEDKAALTVEVAGSFQDHAESGGVHERQL